MARNRRLIITFLCVFTFTAFGFFVFSTYKSGYWRFNYPDMGNTIKGLDVSHHQGKIDWQTVSEQNFQFVYIKATEGADFKDKRFLENFSGARNYGLQVGAYHFFTLCKSGEEQADNFIETVPKNVNMLPPVIDLEYSGNCKNRPNPDALEREILHFSNRIYQTYGYKFYPVYNR